MMSISCILVVPHFVFTIRSEFIRVNFAHLVFQRPVTTTTLIGSNSQYDDYTLTRPRSTCFELLPIGWRNLYLPQNMRRRGFKDHWSIINGKVDSELNVMGTRKVI